MCANIDDQEWPVDAGIPRVVGVEDGGVGEAEEQRPHRQQPAPVHQADDEKAQREDDAEAADDVGTGLGMGMGCKFIIMGYAN